MGILDFLLKKPVPTKKRRIVDENGVEFEYVKIKSSKSIKITIKNRYKVKVTMPYGAAYKAAENFVKNKKDWIDKNLKSASKSLINRDCKTKTNNFIISQSFVSSPVIKTVKGKINFIYPFGADFYSKDIQNQARLALKKALYMEAKEYLPKRLNELALKFGFKYNKLALKAQKTRFGSCSYANNINLNINLMMFPDDFIDYVLIHELCHTVEKNHGARFWALVEKCMPKALSIRKQLKNAAVLV